jgi:glycerol-3-phosphate dehydrogenase
MMDVGIVGGGINGLCCAWRLAELGHRVTLYERGQLMGETSQTSSKLLHGGLRYLENGEFRLVREALRERDAWLGRVPSLAWPLQLTYPIYSDARRSRWTVGLGLFAYDRIAGRTNLPRATWISAKELVLQDPRLNASGLIGGWRFWDGQMDDHALGLWVARRAREAGCTFHENAVVTRVRPNGSLLVDGHERTHERLINAAGPWACQLLERSGLSAPVAIDPVRGSHLVLSDPTAHAYLVEVPKERRMAFILPWKGGTLVGTTEVRQHLDHPITCDDREIAYLSSLYKHYLPNAPLRITGTFAGVRPLILSAEDPGRATREYAFHRDGQLLTVIGGKWTTAYALANHVAQTLG